ncbi:uncharacterized protein MONOS_17565 [Monocercomonoides exilis]|uniref:uncharacterized protein n=1 Tax=Monocercomonoides exilis TaxID=2049356 RepID=UPI00355A52FA|nr:hypothetical protein MONOS_17565 [Monocercomonoides exilis]
MQRCYCLYLLQRNVPLCFSTSYSFCAQAALNGLNGHRMRNGGGRGKDLPAISHSSSHFAAPLRSEERGVRVQMEEAKKEIYKSKLSEEQRKGNHVKNRSEDEDK